MAFSFSDLFSLLTTAPSVISDVEKLRANPQVQDLEKIIGEHFLHTSTPGAASILEPKTTATTPNNPTKPY